MAAYEAPDRRPDRRPTGARAPTPGGLGVVDGWIVADRRAGPAAGAVGRRATAGSCRSPSSRSRAPTTSRTRSRPSRSASLFGVEPDRIRAAASAFTGVEHRLEPVAIDRWRAVRQRFAGHPARRRRRRAARLRPADRADRRRPGQGHRPRRARPGRRRAGGRGRPHRGERAGPRGRVPRRRPRPHRARARPRDRGPSRRRDRPRDARRARATSTATVLLSPAAASFDMFVDYAARGRAFKDAVAASPRPGDGGGDR